MINFGWFSTHSKFQLPWKVDCDDLSDEDIESIARIISWKFAFSEVYGVPTGGTRLADALRKYAIDKEYPALIVDDVLTSGKSMERLKQEIGGNPIGIVVFSRGKCPNWVWSIFTVNEWSQSRATGLG